jgi:hypothetical protein
VILYESPVGFRCLWASCSCQLAGHWRLHLQFNIHAASSAAVVTPESCHSADETWIRYKGVVCWLGSSHNSLIPGPSSRIMNELVGLSCCLSNHLLVINLTYRHTVLLCQLNCGTRLPLAGALFAPVGGDKVISSHLSQANAR